MNSVFFRRAPSLKSSGADGCKTYDRQAARSAVLAMSITCALVVTIGSSCTGSNQQGSVATITASPTPQASPTIASALPAASKTALISAATSTPVIEQGASSSGSVSKPALAKEDSAASSATGIRPEEARPSSQQPSPEPPQSQPTAALPVQMPDPTQVPMPTQSTTPLSSTPSPPAPAAASFSFSPHGVTQGTQVTGTARNFPPNVQLTLHIELSQASGRTISPPDRTGMSDANGTFSYTFSVDVPDVLLVLVPRGTSQFTATVSGGGLTASDSGTFTKPQ